MIICNFDLGPGQTVCVTWRDAWELQLTASNLSYFSHHFIHYERCVCTSRHAYAYCRTPRLGVIRTATTKPCLATPSVSFTILFFRRIKLKDLARLIFILFIPIFMIKLFDNLQKSMFCWTLTLHLFFLFIYWFIFVKHTINTI